MSNRSIRLTPEILLRAYESGIFPMAESAESDKLHWFDPPLRAIIPLDEGFHVPKRLARTIRHRPFTVTLDKAFSDVLHGCAEVSTMRPITWINGEILSLYTSLYWRSRAHSIEVWDNGRLIGGLYGVSDGAAFFGESMFSRMTDASKIALVHLVALLRASGFTLLDTQFQTEHLSHFGTIEVTRANYHHLLKDAVERKSIKLLKPSATDWHVHVETLLRQTQEAD